MDHATIGILSELICFPREGFAPAEEAGERLRSLCAAQRAIASVETIGFSEEGRPIDAYRLGEGRLRISLVAGAHSDEPQGPETLRSLVASLLEETGRAEAILRAFTFFIVPHMNPDGEARNRIWMEAWPDVRAYLRHAWREPPGRDVEFNYPDGRVENRSVANWLTRHGPFSLHMSLHGMGFSDGAMLLVERTWTYRTGRLQDEFTRAAAGAGFRMHDHNRKGEKGFFYVAPGYTTTPEGAAMRAYFQSLNDPETAELFRDTSMEFVRSLGGDPLCVVTELPLFVVEGPSEPMRPTAYLSFKSDLPKIRLAAERGGDMDPWLARYGLKSVSVATAGVLQIRALELGLETVFDRGI